MKCILFLAAFLAFAANLPADEAKAIVYPEDLPRDLLRHSAYAPSHVPTQQEFMEISAPAYPGLKLELPSLNSLVTMPIRQYNSYPSRDPRYYQAGGMILAYWGFPFVTGEIYSTAIPIGGK